MARTVQGTQGLIRKLLTEIFTQPLKGTQLRNWNLSCSAAGLGEHYPRLCEVQKTQGTSAQQLGSLGAG